MAKYKIIPIDSCIACVEASDKETALCNFAAEMELDMRAYFKAVPASEESVDNIKELRTCNSREIIEDAVKHLLCNTVTSDYAEIILNHYDEESEQTVLDAIVKDVIVASDFERIGDCNTTDIRFAIGRELATQLGE